MKRSIALFVFAASLALALLPSVAAAQTVTMRVGTIGLADDIGMFIAMERGYFADKGLKVELVSIIGAGDVMAMLATNRIELVGGGYNVGLFNAIARGLPIRVVAPRALLIPGHDLEAILVRPDLADSIKSVADLKGRKFAVNAPTSLLVYIMGKIMETSGLSIKDLDLVSMPFPNMGTALGTKAIDAAMSVEPFITLLAEKGTAVKWKGSTEFLTNPHVDIGGYFINHEWAEKNPRPVQDFVTQYLRGVRVYYEALTTGKGRDEAVNLLAKYTSMKDRGLYERMQWAFVDPNGTMSRRSVEDQIEWYFGKGMITKKLSANEVIDTRYVERALKELGTVACSKCPR